MNLKTWAEHEIEMVKEDRREWLQIITYSSAVVSVLSLIIVFSR